MTDAKRNRERELDKFEMQMARSGWKAVEDKFGNTVEWENRYRKVSHSLAFHNFLVTGSTPAKML